MVQGHVDGTGTIASLVEYGNSARSDRVSAVPAQVRGGKGFITVDGTSLTITNVNESGLGVAIIPFTFQHTTLNGGLLEMR